MAITAIRYSHDKICSTINTSCYLKFSGWYAMDSIDIEQLNPQTKI